MGEQDKITTKTKKETTNVYETKTRAQEQMKHRYNRSKNKKYDVRAAKKQQQHEGNNYAPEKQHQREEIAMR
jgi:hypothetical protein